MTDDRYATGMAMRRAVLGDPHVDDAEAAKNAVDGDFQRFITEGAWGFGLVPARAQSARAQRRDHRAAGRPWPPRGGGDAHPRDASDRGDPWPTSPKALLHVAVYAGVPAANAAFKVAKEVFEEMDRTAAE